MRVTAYSDGFGRERVLINGMMIGTIEQDGEEWISRSFSDRIIWRDANKEEAVRALVDYTYPQVDREKE